MADPDTRFNAARHEAGHGVVSEMLHPGSVEGMALGSRGGETMTTPMPATRDNVGDFMAQSLAGGLSEPGGTTVTHASGDRDARNRLVGEMASTPMQNLYRKFTGRGYGPDPMLQAPEMQSQGLAKYSALMSNPKVSDTIDNVAGALNSAGRMAGDKLRGFIGR